MMDFPFEPLREIVSPESPCGIDLYQAGDAQYLQFDTHVALALPVSFAKFNRKGADLARYISLVDALLRRSRDLRLMVIAAKLLILDRNLAAFANCLDLIVFHLRERWKSLNPAQGEEDAILRLVALQALDDPPHTVLPLQSVPVLASRRLGPLSLRTLLLAEGQVRPRTQAEDKPGEPENIPSLADVLSGARENDPEGIADVLGIARRIVESLKAIEEIFSEKSGLIGALSLERLRGVAEPLCCFLESVSGNEDLPRSTASISSPSGSLGHNFETSSKPPAGKIDPRFSARDNIPAALAAIERYFVQNEPSSPVRMILRQVDELYGKSFYEALTVLAPDLARRAEIRPLRDMALLLPVEHLASLLPHQQDSQPPDTAKASTKSERFSVGTRIEALTLIDAVSAHLRAVEPSSPLPLILDHARSLSGRDFLSLLQEILPMNALNLQNK
jgi:type VI secretion system protein ImpA